MIKYFSYLILLVLPALLNGQSSDKNRHQLHKLAKFYEPTAASTVEQFVQSNFQTIGLNNAEELKNERSFTTKNGWERHRYTQQYEGLDVLGSAYIIHEKNGQVVRSTGDILPLINLDVNPSVSEASVIGLLKDHMIYEASKHDIDLVADQINIESTQLKIMDKSYPSFSGTYLLVYEIIGGYNIGHHPNHAQYLINANTGAILDEYTTIRECGGPGTAHTHYYGEQEIETTYDPEAEHYVLFDETRNIATVDYNQRSSQADFGYELFNDDDNYWDNANEARDEVAGDAHYCAIAYYDYMNDHFDWKGLSGIGDTMVTVIHAYRKFLVNAYWNGSNVLIGNGDCVNYGPLTTLTVVAHEYAHAFTDFTSDLIYRNESGAINESISDIFGKAVERRYDPEGFSWEIGHKILISDAVSAFRDMSDPNAKNDPKYYRGEDWSNSASAVHTNSGVMNYWAYLLVDGGSDTNEVGYTFDVPSIGFDKLTDIVYGTQVSYFTPDTRYPDAYTGTLQYVEDSYGLNSLEYNAVEEAWKAVGVSADFSLPQVSGEILIDGIIFPICFNECLDIPIEIINTGFDVLSSGTELYMQYESNNTVKTTESIILDSDFLIGDTLMFTFQEQICHDDPTDIGNQKTIEILVSIGNQDDYVEVDQFFLEHQTDLGLDLILDTLWMTADICNPGYYEGRAYVNISSCESLPKDTPLALRFTDEHGNNFIYEFENSSAIAPATGRYDNISFDIEFPLESSMPYTAELIYSEDPFLDNNFEYSTFNSFELMIEDKVETFDDFSLEESRFISFDLGIRSYAEQVNYNGENYLAVGSFRNSYSTLPCDNPQDVYYNYSDSYKSFIELCFDVTDMVEPVLRFDMTPFYSNRVLDLQPDITNMVQVLMPGDDDELVPIITGMPEGVEQSYEFPITSESGVIRIAVVNMLGELEEFELGYYENSDITLFDNIRVEPFATSSTSKENIIKQIKVFPNPAKENVTFEFERQIAQLNIYTVEGQLLMSKTNLSNQFVWDIPSNLKGMLLFETVDRDGILQVGKLLVQ